MGGSTRAALYRTLLHFCIESRGRARIERTPTSMDYQRSRKWLADHRGEMPYGVLASAGLGRKQVGVHGAVASALWEEGWFLYLFASEKDRNAFKAMLPEEAIRPDPLEATKVKD